MKYREKYLECGGGFCPYCGSHDIAQGASVDFSNMSIEATCITCHEGWSDIYTLTDVKGDE